MKRISMVLAAIALVLGLSQCKKQEQSASNEDGTVAITLDVKAHDGSRINVNPNNGTVAFGYGDVVYVASGQKFVGTLTNNGNTFVGNITNPTEGEPLYFFFLGNKTPEEPLTPGSSTTCSVNISDQTDGKYPVVSFATSNETFTGAGLYTAFFLNKAALVKFDVTTLSANPTCILGLNNKVTVDFSTNGFAYSQVDNGLVKLPGGGGEKWAILLPQLALTEGEDGSIYTEEGVYMGTRPTIPAITANDYLNEGIALVAVTETNPSTAPVPEGAVSGKFTINNNCDRVCFSQGNLQYQASTNTWRFAEHQYDFVGGTSNDYWSGGEYGNVYENEVKCSNNEISSTYSGWIDLFGWGTSGYNHGAVCYQPWSTSMNSSDYYAYGEYTYNLYDQTCQADWGYNAIINGGNTEGQWRTLTANEWTYLFYERATLSGIRYVKANVNGVNGFILLPNDWDASTYELNDVNNEYANYSDNSITSAVWTNVLEANGAVFLPFTGCRLGTSFYYVNGGGGYYWSSSHYDNNNSYYVMFEYSLSVAYWEAYWDNGTRPGLSVRLVHSVE